MRAPAVIGCRKAVEQQTAAVLDRVTWGSTKQSSSERILANVIFHEEYRSVSLSELVERQWHFISRAPL